MSVLDNFIHLVFVLAHLLIPLQPITQEYVAEPINASIEEASWSRATLCYCILKAWYDFMKTWKDCCSDFFTSLRCTSGLLGYQSLANSLLLGSGFRTHWTPRNAMGVLKAIEFTWKLWPRRIVGMLRCMMFFNSTGIQTGATSPQPQVEQYFQSQQRKGAVGHSTHLWMETCRQRVSQY